MRLRPSEPFFLRPCQYSHIVNLCEDRFECYVLSLGGMPDRFIHGSVYECGHRVIYTRTLSTKLASVSNAKRRNELLISDLQVTSNVSNTMQHLKFVSRPIAALPARPICPKHSQSQHVHRDLITHSSSAADLAASAPDHSSHPPKIEQDDTNTLNSPAVALETIPTDTLKRLRRDGQQMKDIIKVGRLGAGKGLVHQIQQRWRTSEVDIYAALVF